MPTFSETLQDFTSRHALTLSHAHRELLERLAEERAAVRFLGDGKLSSKIFGRHEICDFAILAASADQPNEEDIDAWMSDQAALAILGAQRRDFDDVKGYFLEWLHVGGPVDHLWIGIKKRLPHPSFNNAPPHIVAFYTTGSPYEKEAMNLKHSLEEWQLDYTIDELPTLETWEQNRSQLPVWLQKKMAELDRPLLYLDIDVLAAQPPNLLHLGSCDFAAYKRDRWQISSSVLYFSNSAGGKAVLDEWAALAKARPGTPTSQLLDAAWEETAENMPLITLWLPQSYHKDADAAYRPGEQAGTVFEHARASRRYRAAIDTQPIASPIYEPDRALMARRKAGRTR